MTSTDTEVLETIQATKGSIQLLGAQFMFHPTTVAMGKAAGMPNGFANYFAGRGGVLGDCDADTMLSAWGFFEPGMARKMWEAGTAAVPARKAGSLYAEASRQWARDHLSGVKESSVTTFNKHAEAIVSGADATALTLFAGWRNEPLPEDPLGRAGQLLHVLREHRGSIHLVALVATGLNPLQAHVTKRGVEGAKLFGWGDPAALPKPKPAAHKKAEALTDKLSIPAYSVLSPKQGAAFVKAVAAFRRALPS